MIVEYRDGELAVDEPIKNFHGAALKGCDECADFLGRSADLSVGSVGRHGRMEQRAGADPSGARGPSTTPGAVSTSASSTTPRPWSSWTPSTSGWPSTACAAQFDPDAPLFIDYAEHVATYEGTDRAPVVADR